MKLATRGEGASCVARDRTVAMACASKQRPLSTQTVRHADLHGDVRCQTPEDEENPSVLSVAFVDLLPSSIREDHATTLFSLFTRLIHDPKLKEFMSTDLPEVDRLPFSMQAVQKYRSEILRKVFDVDQFEPRNREFADELKTNGYGVSTTIIRPVIATSVVVKERVLRKKRKKSNGTAAPTSSTTPMKRKVKTPEEIAEKDTSDKEMFKIGPSYSPDVFIGIDPGMRSLTTAVSVGHRSTRKRHRSIRRRQQRARAQQKQRKERERIVAISTLAYRHLARMNDFRLSYEKLKKREPWYAAVVQAMPSFKASNYDLYRDRLHFFWLHAHYLLASSAEQAFLRRRFTQDRAKTAALTTLATRIVANAYASLSVTGVGEMVSEVTLQAQSKVLSRR